MATAQVLPLAGVQVPTSHWDGGLAVDFLAPVGTPVLAVFDGWAYPAYYEAAGNTVTLMAADGTHAYYAHLDAPGASGPVRAGEVIGHVGTTGTERWGDPHLHFAVGQIMWSGPLAGDGTIAPWNWLAGVPPARPGSDLVLAGVRLSRAQMAAVAVVALVAGAYVVDWLLS